MFKTLLTLSASVSCVALVSCGSSSTASSSDTPPPKKTTTLTVTVLEKRLELAENSTGTNIPHLADGQIDSMRLVQVLNRWRAKYPDKKDIILNSENSVVYSKLIAVFDTLIGNDWPDVGVSTQ